MRGVRVRLHFEDEHLLRKSQRSEGLIRSWLLLPPDLTTISELSSHLIHKFRLRHTRSNALILSMDGYVFPAFESTCIFQDKDIIRVKRKDCMLKEINMAGGEANHIEDFSTFDKQPVVNDVRLLETERFDEDSESKHDKSLKDVLKLQLPSEAPTTNPKKRKRSDKLKSSRFIQLMEKREESTDTSHEPEVKRKLPSRSARRKKAKRKWLRELKKSQKEASENCILENNVQQESPGHQQIDPSTDVDEEVVPVVDRPGHIRFEPLGTGAEGSNLQPESQDPLVIIHWNGTTNKKKGQKWGKEKPSQHVKSNDASARSYHEKSIIEEEVPADDHVDFEKLLPLRSIPKEGDMIAYRLIELSSSWSPELSCFRVGKISLYDPVVKMVKLVTVPDYPVIPDKVSDEELQSSFLPYNEDGSLEISYESLVDVRIFNNGESEPATVVQSTTNEASVEIVNHIPEVTAPFRENGEQIKGAWDEISQALSEKKAQLMKNNGWGMKKSSDGPSWSYKALRSSALGPTMALLRAQNDLRA